MVGWKTSLSAPSTRVNQTRLSRVGAVPNPCLRPGPQVGGAPGPPGACMAELWPRVAWVESGGDLRGEVAEWSKAPPAKRVGGVKLSRGFESLRGNSETSFPRRTIG